MKSSTSIPRVAEFRGRLRAVLNEFSVGILLVLGLTGNHSSWAQSCQGGPQNTNQSEQSAAAVGSYPIRLNDVTLRNQVTWAAQAFVAPERLEGLVPLYVYETDEDNAQSLRGLFDNVPANTDLHLGVAIHVRGGENDQPEIWIAKPYRSIDELFAELGGENGVADGNDDAGSLCIVSSRSLGEVPAVENLWIPEVDWQNGLAQVR